MVTKAARFNPSSFVLRELTPSDIKMIKTAEANSQATFFKRYVLVEFYSFKSRVILPNVRYKYNFIPLSQC